MWLLCAAQFPTTGYITFNLLPYNVTIGRGGVLVDATQGLAAVTIVKSPKEEGIYGIPPVGQWQGAITCSPSCCMPHMYGFPSYKHGGQSCYTRRSTRLVQLRNS